MQHTNTWILPHLIVIDLFRYTFIITAVSRSTRCCPRRPKFHAWPDILADAHTELQAQAYALSTIYELAVFLASPFIWVPLPSACIWSLPRSEPTFFLALRRSTHHVKTNAPRPDDVP